MRDDIESRMAALEQWQAQHSRECEGRHADTARRISDVMTTLDDMRKTREAAEAKIERRLSLQNVMRVLQTGVLLVGIWLSNGNEPEGLIRLIKTILE